MLINKVNEINANLFVNEKKIKTEFNRSSLILKKLNLVTIPLLLNENIENSEESIQYTEEIKVKKLFIDVISYAEFFLSSLNKKDFLLLMNKKENYINSINELSKKIKLFNKDSREKIDKIREDYEDKKINLLNKIDKKKKEGKDLEILISELENKILNINILTPSIEEVNKLYKTYDSIELIQNRYLLEEEHLAFLERTYLIYKSEYKLLKDKNIKKKDSLKKLNLNIDEIEKSISLLKNEINSLKEDSLFEKKLLNIKNNIFKYSLSIDTKIKENIIFWENLNNIIENYRLSN